MIERPPAVIDTHAHLDDARYNGRVEPVLARMRAVGVERVVSIGIDLSTSREAAALAEEYPAVVSAAVGLMPHDASEYDADYAEALEELTRRPGVVAWGEIGLDYHHQRSPAEVQRRVFLDQLRRARLLGLPVVVHSREAHDDTLDVLEEAAVFPRLRQPPLGVLHCFSGAERHARRAIELGYLVSVGGVVTFKNARDFQALVGRLPLEHLVVETDAPYLAPHPRRGKRNEPALVTLTLAKLAELHGVDYGKAARITTGNARRLFRLPDPANDPGDFCYQLGSNLYLNATNRCNNDCGFCVRRRKLGLAGHRLWLGREPESSELIECVDGAGGPERFREVVFCGYGEPLLRLEVVLETANELKRRGARLRIDTNGTAQLELELDASELIARLRPVIDHLNVSLNAADAESYMRLCRPNQGAAAFEAVKELVRAAVDSGMPVTCTAVEQPGLEVEAVRRLAEDLGAGFRLRAFHNEAP